MLWDHGHPYIQSTPVLCDRDHSHCNNVVLWYYKMWAWLHVYEIRTVYDVIIVCVYVIAFRNVRMRKNVAGLILARAA